MPHELRVDRDGDHPGDRAGRRGRADADDRQPHPDQHRDGVQPYTDEDPGANSRDPALRGAGRLDHDLFAIEPPQRNSRDPGRRRLGMAVSGAGNGAVGRPRRAYGDRPRSPRHAAKR